jgi:GLPGLI family protein
MVFLANSIKINSMHSFLFRIQIILVFIYCTAPNQNTYSQQEVMVAYYGKHYLGLKLDSNKVSERVMDMHKQMDKDIAQSMSEVEYQLLFTKTESIFKVIERLGQDPNDVLDLAIRSGDGKGMQYNNLKSNEKLHQKEFFGKLLLIDISARDQKWDLVNETKKIGLFNCFKATTVRITRNPVGTFKKPVIAWYTTDIPFPYGPIGYGDLPGLIIELTYGNCTYFLKKIDLKPKDDYKIEKPVKGKKITVEELYDMDIEASKNASFN